MTEQPELVCVQKCYGMDVAEIFKAKLEAMEIPVLLEYESAGKLFGLTIDGLGEVRVMVPEPFAAEAHALLADTSEGEDEELDTNSESPQLEERS